MTLYSVDTGHHVGGVVVTKNCVTDVPPVFSWMLGKKWTSVRRWNRIIGIIRMKETTKNIKTKKQRYDLERMGTTATELQLFLLCREQFRIKMCGGWESVFPKLSFEFGTCVHWMLYKGYLRDEPPTIPWINKWIRNYHSRWVRTFSNPTEWGVEQQDHIYGLVKCILPHYFRRYAGDFKHFNYPVKTKEPTPVKWLALEKKFKVWYKYKDGLVVPVFGTRDGIFQDKANDIFIMDTKCMSVIVDDQILDKLPLDVQQQLYLWSFWGENTQYASGTVMNIVRRPTLRQGKIEGKKAFFTRVAEDIGNRWDHYFVRLHAYFTPEEQENWRKKHLAKYMKDLRNWSEGKGLHYANPEALVTKYGKCEAYRPILFDDYTGMIQVEPRYRK